MGFWCSVQTEEENLIIPKYSLNNIALTESQWGFLRNIEYQKVNENNI